MLVLLPEVLLLAVKAFPQLMQGKEQAKRWFLQYVPQHISGRAVLGAFSLLSMKGAPSAAIKRNAERNAQAWSRLGLQGQWVEHQDRLGEMRYGRYSADYNACEVIAVYNALLALAAGRADGRESGAQVSCGSASGQKEEALAGESGTLAGSASGQTELSLPELLSEFEHRGITAGGAFGTSPLCICRFFAKREFDTAFFCGRSLQRELAAPHYSVYILTVYNDGRDLGAMVHTVCVTGQGGRFTAHNDYEGTRQYSSLQEAVRGYRAGRAKVVCMTGIGARVRSSSWIKVEAIQDQS